MKKLVFSLVLMSGCFGWAHVPALLLPIEGTPISSYFLGQSEISRAVYSELTRADDFFVIQFFAKSAGENSIEVLTPVCEQVPSYEEFQPSVLVLKGDLSWKVIDESNLNYIARLEADSIGKVESNFAKGERPQFFEEFAKQTYWVGGKLRIQLESGLYSLVVFNRTATKGNFTLGINEKESWTPDLYKYVSEVLPKISIGICDPKGFSGKLNLSNPVQQN